MKFTETWMQYLKDDARLAEIALPGAHNACTHSIGGLGQCQEHDLKTQLLCGVRHFCIRLNTDKKGVVRTCHGITKCRPLREELADVAEFMETHPTEFFILDIREYYPQKVGPITLKYHADPKKVDEIIKEILAPEKYAYTDFNEIGEVTMGKIRTSGKRYLLYNYQNDYAYSTDCPCIRPWEKELYGAKGEKFMTGIPAFFTKYTTDGLYWFQIQQTPNIGTEIGWTFPKKLDREIVKNFPKFLEIVRNNPAYVKNANIIEGDFMTTDNVKIKGILTLNADKNILKENAKERFLTELEKL